MRVGVVQARFWLEAFWGRPTAACKDEKDKMDSAQQVLSVLVSPEFLSSLGLLLIVQGAYLINKRRAAQRVLFGSANVRLPGGGIKPRTIKHAFRRKREAMTKIKYDESAWFKQISGVNVTQEDTIEGQEFRDAFGIPYFLFMYIVSLCRDREWHRKFTADPRGPKRIPLELLILSVLHVLAKSARCNSVYILRFVLAHTACRDPVVLTTQILKRSGVSAPSVRKFLEPHFSTKADAFTAFAGSLLAFAVTTAVLAAERLDCQFLLIRLNSTAAHAGKMAAASAFQRSSPVLKVKDLQTKQRLSRCYYSGKLTSHYRKTTGVRSFLISF